MWNYEKRLQYPVNITHPNAKLAQIIISQFGGPNSNNGLISYSRTKNRGAPLRIHLCFPS